MTKASYFSKPAAVTPSPTPLWKQLTAVAQALQAIRGGQSGTVAIAAVPGALRPGVQALLFQVLRNLGRAQALRQRLAPKAPPAGVDALLCTALALAWHEGRAPYAPFTLVNQAVEAANRGPFKRQSGFVNACLRRFLREQADMVAATDADPQALWNHPLWWIERVQRDYPQDWQAILEANNSQAPMALRVNRRMGSVDEYLKKLEQNVIEASRFGSDGIQLSKAVAVEQLPFFAEGAVSVQDGAAQIAAPLLLDGLELNAGSVVLDACAAPGGKTAHLLEYAGAGRTHVVALEVDGERAQRIHDTLGRLKLTAEASVLVADAGDTASWWQRATQGQQFDAILLDAPCSASGIVRRHPDVRWLRRDSDIAQLADIQARLLDALWPLLKTGGRLLYCTCSVFKAEGADQIEAFLARNSAARLLPSAGHLLPQNPLVSGAVPDNAAGDHDGFFYALLHKS